MPLRRQRHERACEASTAPFFVPAAEHYGAGHADLVDLHNTASTSDRSAEPEALNSRDALSEVAVSLDCQQVRLDCLQSSVTCQALSVLHAARRRFKTPFNSARNDDAQAKQKRFRLS